MKISISCAVTERILPHVIRLHVYCGPYRSPSAKSGRVRAQILQSIPSQRARRAASRLGGRPLASSSLCQAAEIFESDPMPPSPRFVRECARWDPHPPQTWRRDDAAGPRRTFPRSACKRARRRCPTAPAPRRRRLMPRHRPGARVARTAGRPTQRTMGYRLVEDSPHRTIASAPTAECPRAQVHAIKYNGASPPLAQEASQHATFFGGYTERYANNEVTRPSIGLVRARQSQAVPSLG